MKQIEIMVDFITDVFAYGGEFLVSWCVDMLPFIFLVLILTNTLVILVPSHLIEKAAVLASRNILLKYMLIPFIGSILLGNPSVLTLGRFMPEKDKPSYYASASFFCHTSNGIFPHINSAELFIWLGIARGVELCGFSVFPLAIRYLLVGLIVNFFCGVVTDYTTEYYCRKMGIHLSERCELNKSYLKKIRKSTVSGTADSETEPSCWHEIRILAGKGGFGGPLILKPDEKRNKLIYIVGGGIKPDLVKHIEKLTGCTSVNGFKTVVPDEEVFLAVIDCGGTLRCGIYPKKQIPTVNIMPTGKSGPLAKYITEDIYVSAVTEECVSLTETIEPQTTGTQTKDTQITKRQRIETQTAEETVLKDSGRGIIGVITGILSAAGQFCCSAYKAAQDSVNIILHTILPLMGFVSIFTAVIECSGFNKFLAQNLKIFSSDIWGLLLLGIIISFPLLSPILSPGAIIAQVIGTLIGYQIGTGMLAASFALPALFAVNTQAACDFIPVGLGLAEAKEDTIRAGVPSILTSRFLTGGFRVLIAWVFSFSLYVS